MTKRPADERSGGRSPKLPTRRRKHLYLVLDDWELGYSIRKVGLSLGFESNEADDDGMIYRTIEQRLPRAVFRLEAPHERPGQFVPFGTKIMFMGTIDSPWGTAPMYDVRTRALTSAPRRDLETSPLRCAYMQVDGKLFLLDQGEFEMLQPPPPPLDNDGPAGVEVKFDWSWCTLPSPPYHHVISHAEHPDQRTMVFSMTKYSMKKYTERLATFSFDLERS
ncbi:hypothetical protein E2562_038859 [Oryza meyeriana var. granulata]|uniref:DUF1618 domain-containing protein n=1 Tax=Oryza meyeriana var. granulata TaxID=110450 RepID=A0A6G1ENX2_9ORYZ|nr:hypothetical protein E2562_022228 [Oryza meyeriana var. granulata]KAF0936133.1 hypothetical protein E2562_038859 [Oryza meyeriana var. granulata]